MEKFKGNTDFTENERVGYAISLLRQSEVVKNEREIADALGVSRSTISEIQNKKRGVSRAFITNFCYKYGINQDFIKSGAYPIFFKEGDMRNNYYPVDNLENNERIFAYDKVRAKINEVSPKEHDQHVDYHVPSPLFDDSYEIERLSLEVADLQLDIKELEEENREWSRRYIDANKDFIESTKESIELSLRNKTMATAIKTFYEKLQDLKFKHEDDKAQVMKLYEDIVISSLHQK